MRFQNLWANGNEYTQSCCYIWSNHCVSVIAYSTPSRESQGLFQQALASTRDSLPSYSLIIYTRNWHCLCASPLLMCESEHFCMFPLCDLSAHEGHWFFPNPLMLAESKCILFAHFNSNLQTLSSYSAWGFSALIRSFKDGCCQFFPK